jgi:hypothetical protein
MSVGAASFPDVSPWCPKITPSSSGLSRGSTGVGGYASTPPDRWRKIFSHRQILGTSPRMTSRKGWDIASGLHCGALFDSATAPQ